MKRVVVGIAGKSCVGKNQVAEILKEFGFHTLDLDKESHTILEKNRGVVEKIFGIKLDYKINNSGQQELNRDELAQIVFSSKAKMIQLEKILYPDLNTFVDNQILINNKIVLNGVKIFESGFYKKCDFLIWVSAPLIKRIKRAKKRDGKPTKAILKRFFAQSKLSYKPWKEVADIYRVNNRGSLAALKKRVMEILTLTNNGETTYEKSNH